MLATLLKRLLEPLGLAAEPKEAAEKPWDAVFESWLEKARATGGDPNDVGDQEWGDPAGTLERFCYPHLSKDKVVLELGPGTGRYTRHFLKHCSRLIVADSSARVIRFLQSYFADKQNCEIHLAENRALSFLGDEAIDVALAIGVFEHLSLEEFYLFTRAFFRVLRPGGVA